MRLILVYCVEQGQTGNGGGWHSDYPYHGGSGQVGGYAKEENLGEFPSEVPFGLQFNTCITEFTPENGGTCFRLGSGLY